jgi:parallel beta-helix repeat protein
VNKIASGIILTLFIIGTTSLVFDVPLVRAEPGTIYIRADGSIDPIGAPIKTVDNVTYTLTDNITSSGDGIIVERDDVVIDGNGYTLQGSGAYSKGIDLTGRSNVTVKNTRIMEFYCGILLYSSSSNDISGNNITANTWDGIGLYYSSNNAISGNNITANNDYGIVLDYSSSGNSISGNNVEKNGYGISLWSSWGNNISGNKITNNNDYGVYLYSSSNNEFFHNNFIDNAAQAFAINSDTNTWDNGYPSGGNYWSDYNETDSDGDGIGDSPYVIDSSNQDNYPLMHPYIPGDCNHDGEVNMTDANMVMASWLSIEGDLRYNPSVDFNKDKIINILDATVVGWNWKRTCTRLIIENVDFNPVLGVRNFTLTLRNDPLSTKYLNVTAIFLDNIELTNFTEPSLPYTLFPGNRIILTCNFNWSAYAVMGGSHTLLARTLQGYAAVYPVRVPMLAFSIQEINFSPADTTHFYVTVKSQVSTNNPLNVSRIELIMENGTRKNCYFNSPTNAVPPNQTATFTCDWDWTNYRNKNVIVTVYMTQGIIPESGLQTTPPAPRSADINNDGTINAQDARIIKDNWLKHA